jgi:hypothetical protein
VDELKRVGETYSCSCPSWRNQKGAGSMRTCKHLKALRGEQAELERLGGDPKAFFASGNRVAGQAAAAGAGVAPTNEAVVKTVALADSWDGVRDLTGWALSEKLDGMRCLWDGKGGCFSRAGKEVYVPASLCLQLPLGTALDGELWLGRGQFQRAMSIVRRTDRSEVASARLTAGLESITGELVLIRQEMREDRQESSVANQRLFERITEVERGVIDRISGVEVRVGVLEGDR